VDEKLVGWTGPAVSCGSHGDDSPHSRGSIADSTLYDNERLVSRSPPGLVTVLASVLVSPGDREGLVTVRQRSSAGLTVI